MNRGAFLGSAGSLLLAGRAIAAGSLSARMHAIARDLPGRIGVYARTMAPGIPLISYRASERFPTASVIKVLIMTTAYAREEIYPGALSEKITFYRADLIGGSDFMSNVDDGRRFTVRELIAPMITVSDNTAANLLIKHFGVGAINATGRRAGMVRTHLAREFLDYAAIAHHNDNVSTPADIARLLYLIERGARERVRTVVSSRFCRDMVATMLGQTDRDGIPAALPPGTSVANKTGEIDGTRNDAAIVEPFGDSPFVLAIMTCDAYDYRQPTPPFMRSRALPMTPRREPLHKRLRPTVDAATISLPAMEKRELRRASQLLEACLVGFRDGKRRWMPACKQPHGQSAAGILCAGPAAMRG